MINNYFFDRRIQKLNSVICSLLTGFFNNKLSKYIPEKAGQLAFFDCRSWQVPNYEEAVNCLVWRESDATKNSISMAAQSVFDHKELQGVSGNEMQEMLFSEASINWNDYPIFFKRGTYVRKKKISCKFTCEEIENLPKKHNARKNPNLMIERSVMVEESFPPIVKIKNRVDVIFNGAEPITGD